MAGQTASIPDDVARAALKIATEARIQPWTRRADIQGVRDAIAYAYAAGRQSVHDEAEAEWDKQEQAAHYLAEEPY